MKGIARFFGAATLALASLGAATQEPQEQNPDNPTLGSQSTMDFVLKWENNYFPGVDPARMKVSPTVLSFINKMDHSEIPREETYDALNKIGAFAARNFENSNFRADALEMSLKTYAKFREIGASHEAALIPLGGKHENTTKPLPTFEI